MAGRVWRVFAFNLEPARTNGLPPFPGMAFAAFRARGQMRVMPPSHSPPSYASILARGRWSGRETLALLHAGTLHAWYRFQRVSFLSLMNVRPSLCSPPSLIVTSTPTLNVATKGRGGLESSRAATTRITNTSLRSDSAFSSCWTAFRDQFRDFGPSLSQSSPLFYSTYLSQNFGNSRTADTCRPYRPEDRPRRPDRLCWFERRPPQLRPDLTLMDRERGRGFGPPSPPLLLFLFPSKLKSGGGIRTRTETTSPFPSSSPRSDLCMTTKFSASLIAHRLHSGTAITAK